MRALCAEAEAGSAEESAAEQRPKGSACRNAPGASKDEPIGNLPPAEAEARYFAQAEVRALAA